MSADLTRLLRVSAVKPPELYKVGETEPYVVVNHEGKHVMFYHFWLVISATIVITQYRPP